MKKVITIIATLALIAQGLAVNAASGDINATSGLEKIPSPDQIKQYAEVIKRGADLYGVKIASSTSTQIRETASSTLEKILSPDQIQLFDRITKIGASLWGVKKSNNSQNMNTAIEPSTAATSTSSLEKIPSPDKISLFDKIRQVGTALWGIRKDVSEAIKTSFISSDKTECIKAAIDKKDDALISIITSSGEKMTTAINTRRECQKLAIGNDSENGQREALQGCVRSFGDSNKDVTTDAKKNRENAWKTYKEDLRACNGDSDLMIEDGGADLSL